MTSTLTYIKEWQKALQLEIQHLKKYGSSKFRIMNGRLLQADQTYTYFFETAGSLRIPVGSIVKVEWGHIKSDGRILSSEGKSVIVTFEKSFGELIPEAVLYHDPWELLEQLLQRLDAIKKSKQKRLRIKKLMDPSMPASHPTDKIKSSVHELLLRSKYNPVTFVWGPPGTGKTYTLARVAANKYFKEKRVLILAHTNQAVDLLMGEISSFLTKKQRFRAGDIIRYGASTNDALAVFESLTTSQLIQNQDPELAERKDKLIEEKRLLKVELSRSYSKRDSNQLLELETKIAKVLDKIRQKEIEFVKDALLIGTTLTRAASDSCIYEKDFDVVIVDEASMAYVPQTAFAATLGKRVIISGDFKQLPPIAAARHELVNHWLKEDIFHRAGVVDWVKKGNLHPHLFLLKEQRRMHPEISAFTNEYIYNSLVGDHKSVLKKREEIAAKAPFQGHAAVLLDTSYSGDYCTTERSSKSRMNPWQLFLSFQLIHEAYLSGTRSIGYVTPYRAQATLMEKLIADLYEQERTEADITCATVHRFQGSERDVMIFDTVDSNPIERAGMLLIGSDSERLINVAITRTKGKFIHVTDMSFIRKHVYPNKTLRQLTQHQVKNNQIVLPNKIGTWIKHQHSRLQWMHARKLEPIFQDIRASKQSVIMSIPKNSDLTNEWIQQLKNIHKKVKLTIISGEQHQSIHPDKWIVDQVPYPFIIIDHRYFWLGLPLTCSNGVQPPYIALRLDSEMVTEQFLAQIPVDF